MILSTRRAQIYLCKDPTDMRLSFNGLSVRVKKVFRRNPYDGQYFAFVNRRRTSCKVFMWDGTGTVIISKKLHAGLFGRPNPGYKKQIKLTGSEFGQFFGAPGRSGAFNG